MRTSRRLLAASALAGAGLFAASLYLPYPASKLDPGAVLSLRILDRSGILLREVLSDEGGRCRWLGLEGMSPHLVRATIAAEDRDFFLHGGLRLPSIVRALVQNARRGRVVSGASTITQQVVRNIERKPRTVLFKLIEAWLAVRLEHTMSKTGILVQYLNRVPYGNGTFGAEAASRLYFDKPCRQLGLAESAFLAGLPRSPSASNPYRNLRAALERKSGVLRRMVRAGLISPEESRRADAEPLNVVSGTERFRAPHFCDLVLDSLEPGARYGSREVRTTLDLGLQRKIEVLLKRRVGALRDRGISNGAVVVMDNGTGDILALAGSADYFADADSGQVNGAIALRQPGSALKPFTYALAIERGLTAASIIEDVPDAFPALDGNYEPRNYDRKFHGPIRLRSALASSYNVPAVSVLETIGPDLLYYKLKDLGFDSLEKPPGHYGLGLTLGNGEVRLVELVRAFAALASGGRFRRERTVLGRTGRNGRASSFGPERAVAVLAPGAAYIITHILSDPDARVPTFGYDSPLRLPFPCAAKTGTSKDYRDNWTVGYTPAYTVGVWMGNFDGKPMHDVSGITGCGPLFRDICLLLDAGGVSRPFPEPAGLVRAPICPVSGALAGPLCPGSVVEIFMAGTEPKRPCGALHGFGGGSSPSRAADETGMGTRTSPAIRVAYPPDGGVFRIDTVLRRKYQVLGLKAGGTAADGAGEIVWWINGRRAGRSRPDEGFPWNLAPGSYTIVARADSGGRTIESRPVRITVID
ncbi:MAG TPA: penicillin-binding protein 1C [Acidobacteriota bacterium]|nr:penicillin-binding protein 1C [Acidobacteriota bacterium]